MSYVPKTAYVDTTGDTLTGDLILSNCSILGNEGYVTGGMMQANILVLTDTFGWGSVDTNFSGARLREVASPVASNDAATKAYVDTYTSTGTLTPTGWVDYNQSGWVGLYATKYAGMVTLEGLIKPSANVTATAGSSFSLGTAVIPSGYRPAHNVMSASTFSLTGGTSILACRVDAMPSGAMTVVPLSSGTITTASGWLSICLTYRAA
jgi:hypothetical protein